MPKTLENLEMNMYFKKLETPDWSVEFVYKKDKNHPKEYSHAAHGIYIGCDLKQTAIAWIKELQEIEDLCNDPEDESYISYDKGMELIEKKGFDFFFDDIQNEWNRIRREMQRHFPDGVIVDNVDYDKLNIDRITGYNTIDKKGQIVGISEEVRPRAFRFFKYESLINNSEILAGLQDAALNQESFVDAIKSIGYTPAQFKASISRAILNDVQDYIDNVIDIDQISDNLKGKIVNTASLAAKVGAPYLAHYAASKFAVLGFTYTMALELSKYNINVNAVCPGIVLTDMIKREWKWESGLRGIDEKTLVNSLKEGVPLERFATPKDVANMFLFLASEDSDYITGQAFNVNGGIENH